MKPHSYAYGFYGFEEGILRHPLAVLLKCKQLSVLERIFMHLQKILDKVKNALDTMF